MADSLREDLTRIFLESLTDVQIEQEHHTVHHWGGNHQIQGVTTFDLRGEINLDWMRESDEQILKIYECWMRDGVKVDIPPFMGVTPVSFDMGFSFETGQKKIHTRYICDYVEDNWHDFLPNRTHNERKERVMNHKFGQPQFEKKEEDHFSDDDFTI
jgi:hypothetical protein